MLEYTPEDKEFVLINIKFIKTREWYEENKSVMICIESIDNAIKDNDELISINKRLIELYRTDDKYQKKLIEAKREVTTRERFNRYTMIKILSKFNGDLLIKDVINQILGES